MFGFGKKSNKEEPKNDVKTFPASETVASSGKTGLPIGGNVREPQQGVYTLANDEPGLVRLGEYKNIDVQPGVKPSEVKKDSPIADAPIPPAINANTAAPVNKPVEKTVDTTAAEPLTGVSSGVGSPLASARRGNLSTMTEEGGESQTRIASAATAASMHSLERSPEVQTIRQSIQEQHDLQFREIQDLRSQSDTYMKRALSAEDQLLVKATEIEALRRQLDAMVLERDTKWKKLEGDYDSLFVERGNLLRDSEQLNQRILDLEHENGVLQREGEAANRQVVALRTDRDTIYARFLTIQTSAKKVHFGMQHVREGLDELQGPANEVITFTEKTSTVADTGVGVGGDQTIAPSAFKTGISQPSHLAPGISQGGHSLSQSNISTTPNLAQSLPQQSVTAPPSFVAPDTRERGFAVSPSGTPIFHIPETTGSAASRQGTVGAR